MKPVWTPRRHIFTWTIIGGLALGYMWNVSGLPLPDFGLDMLPSSTQADKKMSSPPRTRQQATGEPVTRQFAGTGDRTSVGEAAALRKEIRILRRHVEDLQRREETLNERLSAIESALGPTTSALPPQNSLDPAKTALRKSNRLGAPMPGANVNYLPLPSDGFSETGITPSPLPVASITKTTRTLFGVELATATSKTDLKVRWTALSDKHKNLLGKLKARSRTSAARSGTPASLKLIAGPFSNAADAARLCAKLKAAGADCAETVFTGDTL